MFLKFGSNYVNLSHVERISGATDKSDEMILHLASGERHIVENNEYVGALRRLLGHCEIDSGQGIKIWDVAKHAK